MKFLAQQRESAVRIEISLIYCHPYAKLFMQGVEKGEGHCGLCEE